MSEINIINNLSDNHYQRIIEIANCADTLYLVSPFLMDSFDTLFDEIKKTGIGKIYLITTLKNKDKDLLNKAYSLHSFRALCIEHGIDFEIRIDNKLHGKMYIATKNDIYTCGMITSANLTESGLNRNHEWGLWIDDPQKLEELINEVMSVCSKPLRNESIISIYNKADSYLKTNPEPERYELDLSVDDFIEFEINFSDKRYFIKPVGDLKAPFPETENLENETETLYFSKRKPRSVRVGDVLICYAVGSTKLLGYYEVTASPVYLEKKENDRWPWSVQGKNLSISYSKNWSKYDNTLSNAINEFAIDAPVTYSGGKTLGALNYGSDKIRLSKSFARHLIRIIERDTVG